MRATARRGGKMHRKIKILGIAPYKSLQSMMEKLAKNRNDIELTVFVGDMQEGVEIVQNCETFKYDVIISRGGTAELLQEIADIPVIEIPLSLYDILRAIKLSENYNSKHAIVGFPSITKNAHFLCDLLQYEIDIFTIHNSLEISTTLELLQKKGYRMILGDMITNSMASQFDLASILITSGTESIESAFNQAIKTCQDIEKSEEKREFYFNILNHLVQKVIVFNEQHELAYTNFRDTEATDIATLLEGSVDKVLEEKQRTFYKENGKQLIHACGTSMIYKKHTYVVFSIQIQNFSFTPSRNGIRYLNKESATNKFYESFYGISDSQSPIRNTIEKFNQTDYPIMVIGEEGTGKEQMVYFVYAQSKLKDNPLIIIDCPKINEKSWDYIMNHYKSPINESSVTIHFQGVNMLSENQFQELFSVFKNTNISTRNRILLTYSCKENEELAERCNQIVNDLSCLILHIPSLRSNLNNISNLASLYISYLNLELGKEISGFEPGALDLLKSFSWPHNYNQFKRILNELAVMTTSIYIKTEDVEKILKLERRDALIETPIITSLDFSKTLEEINIDVIEQVLKEEQGNQSNAAKRLGISRTTLWRILQKMQ